MNILVSHVYSKENKGDAALLSVLLSDIPKVFDNPKITILALESIAQDEMFEGVPMKNSFLHYASKRYKNTVAQFFYDIFLVASTFTWAFVYRYTHVDLPLPQHLRDIVYLYRNADLVIPVGGGYIRAKSGWCDTAVLFFTLHPFIFAHILGKVTINYTQSIGPFGNKFQEWMARFTLKRVTGIIARENISLELLRKWGITKNVSISTDSGFSFKNGSKKNLRADLGIPLDQMLVGITVRSWLKPVAQEKYEKSIATLVDYIITKYNATVVFIPQVTVEKYDDDDRKSSKRVYEFISNKNRAHVMDGRYDHHIIKSLCSELDYLVGTRFHSAIFALTSYVPSITVGYEHKTLGIMTDLELEKWVVDIKNVELDKLIEMFDNLVVSREEYIGQLKKVLPQYIEKSEKSIYFVKDIYEQNKRTWQTIERFDSAWSNRIQAMASYVGDNKSVLDLGCGKMWLRRYLKNNAYYPVDYTDRGEGTIICDFNKKQFPEQRADIAFVSGVLEYVTDVHWFVSCIAENCNECVASYCLLEDYPNLTMRRKLTWVNDFSRDDIIRTFSDAGFHLVSENDKIPKNQIFYFKK